MDLSVSQNDSPNLDTQPNKRRRKKSMVWEHFTVETVGPDSIKACCNQCKKSFAYISGSKLSGTSHLKRHILGICPFRRQNLDKDQPSPCTPPSRTNISVNGTNRPRKRFRPANAVASIYMKGDRCSHEFAKMIIQHDYPLHMAEQSGFINFAQTLYPQFSTTSDSVQEQIMNIYSRGKQKLMDLLNEIPGRLSLTMDLWTSNQSLVYVLLTGHFTDYNWKLQRRILNFVEVAFPYSDAAFSHAVAACLTYWNSEGKLFTLTLDRSQVEESARENIRGLLSIKNSLLLNGQLLIKSCYARVLSTLVQDALRYMRKTIEKVRHSVKYVKSSKSHEETFSKLKEKLQVPSTKNLTIDDLTKWNSTYHMLVAASELKEVFSCLDTSDPDYKSTPSMEEWEQVETLCMYLKLFYEAANILVSPSYPTTNIFFHDAWKVQFELMHASVSQDSFVKNLTRSLQEKFTQYWEDCNLVLAVAVVMDPRFKMKLVEFSFSRIYGEDADTWIKIVSEALHDLYLEYFVQSLPQPTFLEGGNDTAVKLEMHEEDGSFTLCDGFADFDIFVSDITGEQHMKSELDQYLEEPLLPRMQDFDVLGWWKVNGSKYPTLSKMASDVLSIPLSTIPPDRVFDTRERKIDGDRSSLRRNTLDALICTKDWLRYESSNTSPGISEDVPTAFVKTEY